MNQINTVFCVALLFLINANGQETLIETDFPIRDFVFENDSVYFIKKRHLEVLDSSTKRDELHFIGGYGIKVFKLGANEILTASDELRRNVSSVRFYDKKKKSITEVYYHKEGNFLDFILVPEENMFLFSTRRNKVVAVKYDTKPEFKKIREFDLGSFSRKIVYDKGNIYCITDSGGLYKYSLPDKQLSLLYEAKGIFTDLQLKDGVFYISSLEGDVIKYDPETLITKELIKLKDDFVTTSVLNEGNLILGTWDGNVYQYSVHDTLSFGKKKIHKKAIYRILYHKGYFYSSSLDKTLRKWKI